MNSSMEHFCVTPRFYDVPMVFNITPRRSELRRVSGGRGVPGGMKYAIFDDPFEAMSFAAAYVRPFKGTKPMVNYRWWGKDIFLNTHIVDYRGRKRWDDPNSLATTEREQDDR